VQTRSSHVLRGYRKPIEILQCAVRGALLLAISLQIAGLTRAQEPAPIAKCPPATRIDSAKDTYGNASVADPYRWLEDQNSPETRAWIGAEQKCTEEVLSKLPGRAQIIKRITELRHVDSFEAPVERGGRYFFQKRLADWDLAKIYMRRGNTADELLVDPLPWSKDHTASATLRSVSKDGKLLFYGRREGGQDEITVHVMDIDARRDFPDVLPSGRYFSTHPTPDNKRIYYTLATEKGPRAYYHEMGTEATKDKLVFGEGLDKQKILGLELSEDGRYLVYEVSTGSAAEKSEVYLQDLKEQGPVVTIVNDLLAPFFPYFAGDRLYLHTNWKAPHWRVFSVNLAAPQREHWQEVIPETDAVLESISPVGGKVAALYIRNAASEMKLFDADGKHSSPIPLPALGSVSSVAGRWENSEAFYTFETYTMPRTIYRYEVATGTSSVWAENNAPFDRSQFDVDQVWYTSKDQTRVPMFLFHKKGLKQDGTNPVILTGYGGFNLSLIPRFSPAYVFWAERGGIVAVPNLRGGGEFGEEWHRAGMLGKKQNVFDDFIAAAEYLIAKKYTSAARLTISGGSNGGLLVGAAMTQRPELFQAVVCLYPLLDMLRYQKFLVAPYWVPEYGSADNPDQFPYLYAYSPYQHVLENRKYPSVLLITGDGDTRVAPLHARKMAARLQAVTGPDRPALLLYDTKSGHSGGRPVTKLIEEDTDIFSYLFWQLRVPAN
jgi:prolyl oligopeptidase